MAQGQRKWHVVIYIYIYDLTDLIYREVHHLGCLRVLTQPLGYDALYIYIYKFYHLIASSTLDLDIKKGITHRGRVTHMSMV